MNKTMAYDIYDINTTWKIDMISDRERIIYNMMEERINKLLGRMKNVNFK